MERKLTILSIFFENPNQEYLIREIARITHINHTTIRQYLKKLAKEGLLEIVNRGLYPSYKLNISEISLNLKLYFNLEKIRKCGIIRHLNQAYDYPTIVLFGSYSKSLDDEKSDIDLFIHTPIKKEVTLDKYAKQLKRNINVHLFDDKDWNGAKSKNPGLVNSICNGITLSGQLEVI